MARKVFGLDIREDAISAVLVKTGFKGSEIESQIHVPLQEPGNGIAPALKTIVGELDIDGAVCVASLPAHRVSFRYISVPFRDTKRIRQILPFELESTLPVPIEDLIVDFQAIQPATDKNRTDILAALVEKSHLESYLTVLADFDIQPEIVTCGGYGISRLLIQLPDFPPKGLVVDIEERRGTIFIVDSRHICLVRPVPINPSAKVSSLCLQITRTLMAYKEMSGFDFQPEAVFVTGRGLGDKTMESEMSKILGLPVRRTDLVRDIDDRIKHPASQTWNPLQLDGAVSLALMELKGGKGINFRKGPFAQKRLWGEYRKRLMTTAMIAGLVLVLTLFNIFYDVYLLKQQVAGLDREITGIFKRTFPDVDKIVDPVHQMRVKIKAVQKSALLPGQTGNPVRTIDLLNEISKLIPKGTDVELTRLVIGPENLLIDGNTDTFNTVDDIKRRLEGGSLFKGITISSANIDRAGKRVRFKLKGGV